MYNNLIPENTFLHTMYIVCTCIVQFNTFVVKLCTETCVIWHYISNGSDKPIKIRLCLYSYRRIRVIRLFSMVLTLFF